MLRDRVHICMRTMLSAPVNAQLPYGAESVHSLLHILQHDNIHDMYMLQSAMQNHQARHPQAGRASVRVFRVS